MQIQSMLAEASPGSLPSVFFHSPNAHDVALTLSNTTEETGLISALTRTEDGDEVIKNADSSQGAQLLKKLDQELEDTDSTKKMLKKIGTTRKGSPVEVGKVDNFSELPSQNALVRMAHSLPIQLSRGAFEARNSADFKEKYHEEIENTKSSSRGAKLEKTTDEELLDTDPLKKMLDEIGISSEDLPAEFEKVDNFSEPPSQNALVCMANHLPIQLNGSCSETRNVSDEEKYHKTPFTFQERSDKNNEREQESPQRDSPEFTHPMNGGVKKTEIHYCSLLTSSLTSRCNNTKTAIIKGADEVEDVMVDMCEPNALKNISKAHEYPNSALTSELNQTNHDLSKPLHSINIKRSKQHDGQSQSIHEEFANGIIQNMNDLPIVKSEFEAVKKSKVGKRKTKSAQNGLLFDEDFLTMLTQCCKAGSEEPTRERDVIVSPDKYPAFVGGGEGPLPIEGRDSYLYPHASSKNRKTKINLVEKDSTKKSLETAATQSVHSLRNVGALITSEDDIEPTSSRSVDVFPIPEISEDEKSSKAFLKKEYMKSVQGLGQSSNRHASHNWKQRIYGRKKIRFS